MSHSYLTVPCAPDNTSTWSHAQAELVRQGVSADEPTLESLIERALQILVANAPAHRASLSVLDPVTGRLNLVGAVGFPETRVGQPVAGPRSVSEWVLRVGRGLVLQGAVRTGEIEGIGDTRILSSMVIPISGERGTLGVLSLGRGPGLPGFVEAELPLAMSATIPFSLAIARAVDAARARRVLAEVDAVAPPGAPWRGRPLATPQYECAAGRLPGGEPGWSFVTAAPSGAGSPVLLAAPEFVRGLAGLEQARFLEGAFHALCSTSPGLESLTAQLDQSWRMRFGPLIPISVWLARFGPSGAIESCTLGESELIHLPLHDPPVRLTVLCDPGLGSVRKWAPSVKSLRLLPGDRLLFASLSVPSSANPAGVAFGPERLLETLEGEQSHELDALVRSACMQALVHGGRPAPRQDFLAVGIRYQRGD